MSQECVFCKIISGDIPSFTIYEDELFKVILDRFPASKGHMLIVAKEHFEDVFSMPEQTSKALYPLVQQMAKLLKEKFDVDGINIVQNNGLAAGQSVFHFHLHLVPRYENDKLILNQTVNSDTTIEELQEVAALLK